MSDFQITNYIDEQGQPHGSACPACGGRSQSPNEFDGICYSCADRPDSVVETLRYARTRAGLMGECLTDYLTKPERFGWTVEQLYEMACEAAHNGRLVLGREDETAEREVA